MFSIGGRCIETLALAAPTVTEIARLRDASALGLHLRHWTFPRATDDLGPSELPRIINDEVLFREEIDQLSHCFAALILPCAKKALYFGSKALILPSSERSPSPGIVLLSR